MKMQEVRALARSMGIRIGGLTKIEAIRKLQRSEGNFDCFGRAANGYCDQTGCLFYEDCMKVSIHCH
ncbi:MAG: hypothetical protein PWQ57_1044 [Desulfovibrionales bacterium]|jgi:hypothetical protein|nr:hypothetical protein [Desulfovibrionales bacterium]